MNIFNMRLVRRSLSLLLHKGHVQWLPYCFKYLPMNWKDHKNNNFFHFAAKHQNDYLFEIAIHNKANINDADINGNAPIHRFIESSFIINDKKQNKDKEEIIFDPNERLLKKFIEFGTDVNQLIKYEKKENEWTSGVKAFSKKNITGTPIELLISIMWDKGLMNDNESNDESIIKYNNIFKSLSNAGANINLLVEPGQFYNLENEKIVDAMQLTNSIIVSHFFIKFIRVDIDLEVIKPLLNDPRLDFGLTDESDNTVLHNLFGRISARYTFFKTENIHEILKIIFNNPSFKEEHLYMKNTYGLSVIKCFKKDASEYAQYLEKLFLNTKLEKELLNKPLTIKRTKI